MKFRICAALMSVTALALPAQAQAPRQADQCFAELKAFDRQIAADRAAHLDREELRTLVRAAEVFSRNGDEQACQFVLRQAMAYVQAAPSGSADAGRRDAIGIVASIADYTLPLRAERIVGGELRNLQNEQLGDIADIVMNPNGTVRYLLVARGGVLGIGEDWVAVPWTVLRISADGETFVLPMSEEQFSRAPTIDTTQLRASLDETWLHRNEAFYKAALQ